MTMGLKVYLSKSICNNCFETPNFKKLEIIMLENWQGDNTMVLIATLAYYKTNNY